MKISREAEALRSGRLDLIKHIHDTCDRIEAYEPEISAFVPGTYNRERILEQARRLLKAYPDPGDRPSMFGLLVGVKDIFRIDGFRTGCGSELPDHLFDGPEADCITRIKKAGSIIAGKTVTAEFAYIEPGPTRNPYNTDHTPGGSSSGSAAGTAKGFFPFALGTQTVGSTIRPAAFCGVIGFKPSYGRISAKGVIPFSPSSDHVGIFCRDISGLSLICTVMFKDWEQNARTGSHKRIGIPADPYLFQASDSELSIFREQVHILKTSGLNVREYSFLEDIKGINELHYDLIAAEMAREHAEWFSGYRDLYRSKTVDIIEKGMKISDSRLKDMISLKAGMRDKMIRKTASLGVDFWISPSATDRAPKGLGSTGSALMNLPWTFTGMPAVSLPVAFDHDGLPHGIQVAGGINKDEELISFAGFLSDRIISNIPV